VPFDAHGRAKPTPFPALTNFVGKFKLFIEFRCDVSPPHFWEGLRPVKIFITRCCAWEMRDPLLQFPLSLSIAHLFFHQVCRVILFNPPPPLLSRGERLFRLSCVLHGDNLPKCVCLFFFFLLFPCVSGSCFLRSTKLFPPLPPLSRPISRQEILLALEASVF